MIWGIAGFIFQDKMFAFPIRSRAFQISSSGAFDLILHRNALTSSSQKWNLRSCLYQWPVFRLLIGLDTVTCLDAWPGISAVSQRTNLCHQGFLWGKTDGGIWMCGTSCWGAPGFSRCFVLEWLTQDTTLQCESPETWICCCWVQASLLLNCVGRWDPSLWEQSTHSSWLIFLALGWPLFAVGSRKISILHLN